jgi:DNA-binding NtrC family response regulator
VAVSCGAFTEGLLASELFGHVRGAFTGAVQGQQGLFRSARGGTLLLDDVAEIPLALQPTLLRVLETWQVRPVGSTRDVDVDVRVVATTNRELLAMVQEGLFRSDLYARLAQWTTRLPALRERREDIPALTAALLGRCNAAERPLTPNLQEALLVHDWPMNVRWLLNVLSVASIVTLSGPLALGDEVREALGSRAEGGRAHARLDPILGAESPLGVRCPAQAVSQLLGQLLETLLRRGGEHVVHGLYHRSAAEASLPPAPIGPPVEDCRGVGLLEWAISKHFLVGHVHPPSRQSGQRCSPRCEEQAKSSAR